MVKVVFVWSDNFEKYFPPHSREDHYRTYTVEMGFSNLELYCDEFTQIRPGTKSLENVVAVLATPPNTNTAVKDPIELVVSKV